MVAIHDRVDLLKEIARALALLDHPGQPQQDANVLVRLEPLDDLSAADRPVGVEIK